MSIENRTWKKGTAKWLTQLIEEGFEIMRAYVNKVNLEIYLNRKMASQHVQGSSPEYELVQESYDTIWVYLDDLRIMNVPRENVRELSDEFIGLGRKCERKHWEEQNGN